MGKRGSTQQGPDEGIAETPWCEPFELPIDGILDLHAFAPSETPQLLTDYMELCREKGIFTVRVIHGKGTGALRRRVHALLARSPAVVNFFLDKEPGGWGATIVELIRGTGKRKGGKNG